LKLKFFCTRWGYEHIPWDEFCKKVKAAGYDGVETTLPLDTDETQSVLTELANYNLELIAVQWDTGTPNFNHHIEEYKLRLRSAAAAKPLFITSHTGKDFFSVEQNTGLLNLAHQISNETGVKIIHETHRGKFSFAAHVTKEYLLKLPWLCLTLDISHWFTVAESYLIDQQDAVNLALQHTDHIHARIGHSNGPQVIDPRSPEWKAVVNMHFALWSKIINIKIKNGTEQLTFTTEFGPFSYMQLRPFENVPLANQWEINEYMLNLLKTTYKNYL
jgi:sugar phosphate isomerase/epimerase